MTIKSTRYVDIASAVIGQQSVPQRKLVGRVFTQSPLIPAGAVVSFTAGEVERLFGAGTPEAEFASAYFAYISPAPVSRASELQMAAYIPGGRAASVYGGEHAPLTQFESVVDGSLEIELGPDTVIGEAIDFTGVESLADVATTVTAALSTGTVTFDAVSGRFILTGTTVGPGEIDVVPTSLAALLGFTDVNAVLSAGADPQTPVEAFQASEQISDSFGSAFFMDGVPLADAVELATYVAAENVKYQLFIDVPRVQAAEYSEAFINTASVGLNLEATSGPSISHLPMAILAATNYDRGNAAVNYMFRRGGVTIAPQVTTNQDADLMDSLRINYYGQTASAGTNISFYQRGFLCGGAGAPISMSIHANEQWLKSFIAAQWLSLLLDTRGIPANADGRGRGLAVIGDAITQAIENGTIIAGKTLTPVQRAAVSDAAGDPLAWHDVQNKGYWYDVQIVPWNDAPSDQAEYLMQYVIVYSKGDWVNKIEGSHNLV